MKKGSSKSWIARVQATSNAMDVEPGTFTRSAEEIAELVFKSAKKSKRRKRSPFASAISMIVYYQNRGGKKLSPERHRVLERAKEILRERFRKKNE